MVKNYRQRDESFLALLHKVRAGTIADNELAVLNGRYIDLSMFDETYVHMTSTNSTAELRNISFLDRITAVKFVHTAKIVGEFSVSTYPTDV